MFAAGKTTKYWHDSHLVYLYIPARGQAPYALLEEALFTANAGVNDESRLDRKKTAAAMFSTSSGHRMSRTGAHKNCTRWFDKNTRALSQ